jgi:hypothetical protein
MHINTEVRKVMNIRSSRAFLSRLGFKPVGESFAAPDRASGLDRTGEIPESPGVYAFLAGGAVMLVGKRGKLRSRVNN